jgi:LPS sulfotransferase NodH
MLEATGIAGRPTECFHEELLKSAAGKSARYHLRRATVSGTTENGVFGGKVHWSQFESLLRCDDAGNGLPMLLARELPELRYVWLTRRDKARQAISYYRAIRTGVWWWTTETFDAPDRPEPEFDFDTIERYENLLICQEGRWQSYFEGLNLDPFVLVYEEFADNLELALQATLDELHLSSESDPPVIPALSRQSDEMSEAWLERYTSMKAGWSRSSAGASRREPRFSPIDSAPIMNPRELRVASLQRGGHHGVINWIAAQCKTPILFLNDVEPATNPFFTATIASRIMPMSDTLLMRRATIEPFARRECLVHSYEDRRLCDVFGATFESQHDDWVGRSERRWDLIVLRDPFNTFASRMGASWMRHSLQNEQGRAVVVSMWKDFAREALGLTYDAPHQPVIILFNRWFTDIQYRQELSTALDLPFSDAGFQKISAEYGGSTFDGMRFDGNTHEMKLLTRWTRYADDPLFCSIFADFELLELSEELFGILPGTEQFYRSRPLRDSWAEYSAYEEV